MLRVFWKPLLFIALTFLTLGAILGYRINFQQRTIEEVGVLHLEGQDKDISFFLDKKLQDKITLPYTNHTLSLGSHEVDLFKPGYERVHIPFIITKDRAVVYPIEFTPFLTNLPRQNFELKNGDVSISHQLIYECILSQKLCYLYQNREHILEHIPTEKISLDGLHPEEHIISIEKVGTAFLIQTSTRNLLKQSEGKLFTLSEGETYVELGNIYQWNEKNHTLGQVDLVTGTTTPIHFDGTVEQHLLQRIWNATQRVWEQKHTFICNDGSFWYLTSGRFGQKNFIQTKAPLLATKQNFTAEGNTGLTGTGAFLVAQKVLLNDVQFAVERIGDVLLFQKSGVISTLTNSKVTVANTLSEDVENYYEMDGLQYSFIKTKSALYHCTPDILVCSVFIKFNSPTKEFTILSKERVILYKQENQPGVVTALFWEKPASFFAS